MSQNQLQSILDQTNTQGRVEELQRSGDPVEREFDGFQEGVLLSLGSEEITRRATLYVSQITSPKYGRIL